MAIVRTNPDLPGAGQKALLYHFCRLQLPFLTLALETFELHLLRCFQLYQAKQACPNRGKEGWALYLGNLHALDWFLCSACLEGQTRAWQSLFAARASRSDCLLVDALRARAVRLYPRDEERQDNAVTEFWGYLLAGERPGSMPILARYDGQRPLVPWLIRVFQNKHISELRRSKGLHALPEEELDDHDLTFSPTNDARWHEEFRQAARDWLSELSDGDLLTLGLRLRYRLSQRQVAQLLGIHEGNVSRQTTRLRDQCLEQIGHRLVGLGWTGDDLSELVRTEMDSVLLEEPRLSAEQLAILLGARGKKLPKLPAEER
jgi:RNA polymerase sigma factor (sigma-70 family)